MNDCCIRSLKASKLKAGSLLSFFLITQSLIGVSVPSLGSRYGFGLPLALMLVNGLVVFVLTIRYVNLRAYLQEIQGAA